MCTDWCQWISSVSSDTCVELIYVVLYILLHVDIVSVLLKFSAHVKLLVRDSFVLLFNHNSDFYIWIDGTVTFNELILYQCFILMSFRATEPCVILSHSSKGSLFYEILLTLHLNRDSLKLQRENTAGLSCAFGPGLRSALQPAGFTGREPSRWAMATVHFLTHWPHLLHFTMRNKRGPILASSQTRRMQETSI